MVEIVYNENPCVFDLCFNIKEYIPAEYFETSKNETSAELNYFIDMLTKNKMLSSKISYVQMIWSRHYKCFFHGTSFIMIYDEDYGFVSFAVDDPKDRVKIAEVLKDLIKKEKLL